MVRNAFNEVVLSGERYTKPYQYQAHEVIV